MKFLIENEKLTLFLTVFFSFLWCFLFSENLKKIYQEYLYYGGVYKFIRVEEFSGNQSYNSLYMVKTSFQMEVDRRYTVFYKSFKNYLLLTQSG